MDKFRWAVLVTALVVLSGCSAPEDRIRESCIRNGGFNRAQGASEAAQRQCACFATQLKTSLPKDQLEALAAIMDTPPEKREEALRNRLTVGASTAVLGAAKSCALQ